MRVLIVDDSRAMRLMLKKMMQEIGATDIAEAGNGQEALDAVSATPPHLAMVDWNMPVMNGLDFVKALRTSREHDRIKVMMVTSESSPRQIYEAIKAGADEYAMKPINREIITDKLQLMGLA